MSDRDWRPGNPVWEDLREEESRRNMKEVPLVIYDKNGGRIVIGTAKVEKRKDGIYVEGTFEDDGGSQNIRSWMGLDPVRDLNSSDEMNLVIDPAMIRHFYENPPIRIELTDESKESKEG